VIAKYHLCKIKVPLVIELKKRATCKTQVGSAKVDNSWNNSPADEDPN
jgi:hypothetical protein